MHRLLERQVRRSFGEGAQVPEGVETLLDQVHRAYEQADTDRLMLQRSLELSSGELLDANVTLRSTVGLLEATLNAIEDGVLVVGEDNRVNSWNRQFLRLWRCAENEVPQDLAQLVELLAPALVDRDQLREMLDVAERDSAVTVTRLLQLQGDRYLQATMRPTADPGGLTRVWSFHDLTEIKRAENTIRHSAFHDALTGLPNRVLLEDRLAIATAHSGRVNRSVAVYFIDLDQFKQINDTLGHSCGDQLLKDVSARLKGLCRSCDTLARFGGDEFVFVAQGIKVPSDAALVAQRILAALRPAFTIEGRELHVTTSIGVALYPDDASDTESLIRRADVALYAAKDQGRDTFEMYRPHMNSEGLERLLLENALRLAIRDRTIDVAFQPIFCTASGRIRCGEALARWTLDGSPIAPGTFIPIAENAGLIDQLGAIVLERALDECRAWRLDGAVDVKVAVNVSTRQLNSDDFASEVLGLLRAAGLPPDALEIEITESTLMEFGGQAEAAIVELTQQGVGLALDDFGTGYSSLKALRELPLSTLKIDRAFVAECHANRNDASLITTIVSLGHSIGLSVVAEGAETQDQVDTLTGCGCDAIQGFLLGRPMPSHRFRERLQDSAREEGSGVPATAPV